MTGIKALYEQRSEERRKAKKHEEAAELIKRKIEYFIAQEFGIDRVLMSGISKCKESPVGRCFVDVDSGFCIYCDARIY